MPPGADPQPLDKARRDAGLSHGELWLRYFELGGMSTAMELEAFLFDALQPSVHDHDLIAHALNERYFELSGSYPVAYLEDAGSSFPATEVLATSDAASTDVPRLAPLEPRPRFDGHDDRVRVAADLHDTVIQRLFATGLALHAVMRAESNPATAKGIEVAIIEIDATIREIRSTIFELESPGLKERRAEGLMGC